MPFASEQLSIIKRILNIGDSLGATAKQKLAALEAAYVESRFNPQAVGDNGTAFGVFQQTPKNGWGSRSQVVNIDYAIMAFFRGAGTNPGAMTVNQSGTAGVLAQRVQRSAFPTRYDAAERYVRGFLDDTTLAISSTISPPMQEKYVAKNPRIPQIILLAAGAIIILIALAGISK